jgi:hypothetical protein
MKNSANETQGTTLETVTLPINGKEQDVVVVMDLDPRDKLMALVPHHVLKRLAKQQCHSATFSEIKSDFLQEVRDHTHDIESFVAMLEEHLDFHKTVNVIATAEIRPQDVNNNKPDITGIKTVDVAL